MRNKTLEQILLGFEKREISIEESKTPEDRRAMYDIFCEILKEGTFYAAEPPYAFEDFVSFSTTKGCRLFVGKQSGRVVGGFYLRPNQPGKGAHVGNAGYMISSSSRGQGLGKLLGEASLEIAQFLGYRSMIFNLVFSQNLPAVNLWKKIGFSIIGTIPEAVRNRDGSYQDAYIMYRSLV